MKKVLALFFTAVSGIAFSQLTTTNPDTVCYQSALPSTYTVPSVGTGTYTWTVSAPGVITSGQGTNTINVNWSAAAPGLIPNGVSVTYSSPAPANCPADPVTLNILIHQIIPTITVIGPFCEDAACVTLTGTPAGGTFSGPGVIGNQFCPTSANIGVNNVVYTVNSSGCTFSTTLPVTVNPTPVLSPIQHN